MEMYPFRVVDQLPARVFDMTGENLPMIRAPNAQIRFIPHNQEDWWPQGFEPLYYLNPYIY
jgi:hypothetical protein